MGPPAPNSSMESLAKMKHRWPIMLLAAVLLSCAPEPAPEEVDEAEKTKMSSEAELELHGEVNAEQSEDAATPVEALAARGSSSVTEADGEALLDRLPETRISRLLPGQDRQEVTGRGEITRRGELEDAPVEANGASRDARREDAATAAGAAAVDRAPRPRSATAEAPGAVPQVTGQLVDKKLRYVRIFYGTNRARTDRCLGTANVRWNDLGPCRPNHFYAIVPAEKSAADSGLEVGTLAVTFPPGHRAGRIERPLKVFSFTLREDPDDHVMISELDSRARDYPSWVRDLKNTGRTQAFIYVHGFGTTFDEAARRAAQVAFDLDFDQEDDFRGVPMMYSWPSNGKKKSPTAYASDYDRAIAEDTAFNQFLDLVKTDAGIDRVHMIAHSMGSLVVAGALERRTRPPEPIISQLALAAPDIPAALFEERFLKVLPEFAERVTLYVSDSDKALIASSKLRLSEPRAGQVKGGLLEASSSVKHFDGINASDLPTDFLAHSYWANNDSMLSDIYCLLKGVPAEQRPLLMLAGVAWSFKSPELLRALDTSVCTASVALSLPPTEDDSSWSWWLSGLALLALLLVVSLILRARLRRRRPG